MCSLESEILETQGSLVSVVLPDCLSHVDSGTHTFLLSGKIFVIFSNSLWNYANVTATEYLLDLWWLHIVEIKKKKKFLCWDLFEAKTEILMKNSRKQRLVFWTAFTARNLHWNRSSVSLLQVFSVRHLVSVTELRQNSEADI